MNTPKILLFLSLSGSISALAADPPSAGDANTADTKSLSDSAEPRAATSSPAKPAANRQQPASSAASGRRGDRLDLDTTIVTGNRELPKVLYIVPWKKADIGDLPAQPFNTLLDEALTPVDRDVFRREVTYYGAMSSGADRANPASAAPAAGPEK